MLLSFLAATSFGASFDKILVGRDAKLRFTNGQIAFFLVGEDREYQISTYDRSYYIYVDGIVVGDFETTNSVLNNGVTTDVGFGNQLIIESTSKSTGIKRKLVFDAPLLLDSAYGAFYVKTVYTTDLTIEKFVQHETTLNTVSGNVWCYGGGGDGPQSQRDTVEKVKDGYYRKNPQDETSAGIPVSDIYFIDGGVTVADASLTRREVSTPISGQDDTATVSLILTDVQRDANHNYDLGPNLIVVHKKDYYLGLKTFSQILKYKGFKPIEKVPESSYAQRWESWGWEFDWTIDLIISKLDELKEAGVNQITLDDGWYTYAGEWELNKQKFPNGVSDMKRLTDAIHSRGMTALIWWRPCDGGREQSSVYKNHPDYFVKNQDGSFSKLAGPGGKDHFGGTAGYALCPLSEGALKLTTDFITRAMKEWGFDGFKDDYVWSMTKCYNPAHNHKRPHESTEQQYKFYKVAYEAMVKEDPNAYHLLCNCGVPIDHYSLPYLTQIPTADPISVDQTRTRVKAYKALYNDYFPVTTDHNEIWYESTVGVGAVLIEKRAFTEGSTQDLHYKTWLKIANEVELHKGRFVGDLYSYGFDAYETYVVEKDGMMYYAFYKDGTKFTPSGDQPLAFKGLKQNKHYRIYDYVHQIVIAEDVVGPNPTIDYKFEKRILLRAEEI